VRVTPRRLLGGLGLFGGGAVLCAFFGIAMLIAALLGPEAVLWTGTAVHGTEADGKVTYTFRGTTYQLDEPNSHATRNVILYLDPAHPDQAQISTTVRQATHAASVGAPFAAALAFLAAGVWRRRRVRRRLLAERAPGGRVFGQGLDPDVVAQLLGRRDPDR